IRSEGKSDPTGGDFGWNRFLIRTVDPLSPSSKELSIAIRELRGQRRFADATHSAHQQQAGAVHLSSLETFGDHFELFFPTDEIGVRREGHSRAGGKGRGRRHFIERDCRKSCQVAGLRGGKNRRPVLSNKAGKGRRLRRPAPLFAESLQKGIARLLLIE